MITAKITAVLSTLVALTTAAHAEQTNIEQHLEGGRVVALFKVGDSNCRLVNDEIRCTRVRN
jgi:hypothetical protein